MKAGPPRHMDSSDYTPSYEAVQQFHQHQNRERMEKYRLESGGLMDLAESIDEKKGNNRRPNRDPMSGVEARTLQKVHYEITYMYMHTCNVWNLNLPYMYFILDVTKLCQC